MPDEPVQTKPDVADVAPLPNGPSPPPSGDEPMTDAQFEETWNFDPFKPEAEAKPDAQPQTDQPQATPAPEAAPPVTPAAPDQPVAQPSPPVQPVAAPPTAVAPTLPEPTPAAPAAVPGQPPVPPKAPTEMEVLQQQVASQSTLINRLLQAQQAAVAQPPAAVPEKPAFEVPAYDFQIPTQLVEQMNAEDQGSRQQAMGQLVKGAAQGVHQTIMTEVHKIVPEMIKAQVGTMVQSQRSNDAVYQDFFGAYPQFNNDLVRPLVQRAAEQVMTETGQQEWSQGLRDRIAQRVQMMAQTISGMQPQPQPQPQPVPQAVTGVGALPVQPVARPPATVFAGTATPGVDNSDSVPNQVRELMGL